MARGILLWLADVWLKAGATRVGVYASPDFSPALRRPGNPLAQPPKTARAEVPLLTEKIRGKL
jgi:hypothetical protein